MPYLLPIPGMQAQAQAAPLAPTPGPTTAGVQGSFSDVLSSLLRNQMRGLLGQFAPQPQQGFFPGMSGPPAPPGPPQVPSPWSVNQAMQGIEGTQQGNMGWLGDWISSFLNPGNITTPPSTTTPTPPAPPAPPAPPSPMSLFSYSPQRREIADK